MDGAGPTEDRFVPTVLVEAALSLKVDRGTVRAKNAKGVRDGGDALIPLGLFLAHGVRDGVLCGHGHSATT